MDDEVIYECWIDSDKNNFQKIDNAYEVSLWLFRKLDEVELHKHIHIVPHLRSEYEAGQSNG